MIAMRLMLLTSTATLIVVTAGCKLPSTNRALSAGGTTTDTMAPAAGSVDISKHLLIGPEGMSQVSQTELPPKEAAVACFKAAQKMDQNGQPEEAIKLYEKARSFDAHAYGKQCTRRLAVMYDNMGDFIKATTEYEQALKDTPNDGELLNDIGYSYYCRGDWDRAAVHLEKAVQLKPDLKRAWMNLGLTRAQRRNYGEAFEAFSKAVKPSEARCNIAFVLAAQGKVEEARAEYAKALELEPGLRIAQMALSKLGSTPATTVTKGGSTTPAPTSTPTPAATTTTAPSPVSPSPISAAANAPAAPAAATVTPVLPAAATAVTPAPTPQTTPMMQEPTPVR